MIAAWIRASGPLVLMALALLVWLEGCVPGADSVRSQYGETAVVRFVLGCVCLYVAMLIVEAQHKAALFKQVLEQFKQFHEARKAADGQGGVDAATKKEAVRILLSALQSEDPEVAQSARENLTRLAGKDHGTDPEAWSRAFGI